MHNGKEYHYRRSGNRGRVCRVLCPAEWIPGIDIRNEFGSRGLCAAWKRKGYTWDISMHMLTNSRRGTFRTMWEELGVVGEREFHYHREFARFESNEKKLAIGVDRSDVEKAMLALSPADAKMIKEFAGLLYGKGLAGMANLKPPELFNFADTVKMFAGILPFLGLFRKYSKMTI